MKTPKIIALALSLFGASLAPAAATTTDYILNVPLVGVTDSSAAGFLTGTLSLYDDALNGLGKGLGNFTLIDTTYGVSDTRDYSGWASILPMDNGTGIYFDADGVGGGSLYFSLATTTFGDGTPSGSVTFCNVNQICAMYNGVGASMAEVVIPPVGLPGSGIGVGVSPVPLPPAVSMFGSALLALGGLGAASRRIRAARLEASRRESCVVLS